MMKVVKMMRNMRDSDHALPEVAGAPSADEMEAANLSTGLFNGISTLDLKTEKANLLNHVSDYKGWKEVEITVDSGACDPVMPVHCCSRWLSRRPSAPGWSTRLPTDKPSATRARDVVFL